MDSCNSGSLQSSSGGDDEYDSRAAGSIFITQPSPPMFDPFSQLHNPNMAWLRPAYPRSDPNPAPHELTNPFMPCFQPPPENNNPGGVTAAQNPTLNTAAARNPKKRSRASRRAPTTVLTTDTTNFRAMVQEFTGIPAPPFTNNNNNNSKLSFPRINGPDFFGTAAPYLRRPFAQKAQTAPFLASSANNNNISISAPINYQIPLITQNSNNLFSSLLQTSPKFIFSDSSSVMASKPQNQGTFEIGPGLDEFGSGQGNNVTTTLNDLPGLISNERISARNDRGENTENHENAAKWRRVIGPNEGDGNYQAQMKPVNDGYGFSGPENVVTKGEGMVESWIYSSE